MGNDFKPDSDPVKAAYDIAASAGPLDEKIIDDIARSLLQPFGENESSTGTRNVLDDLREALENKPEGDAGQSIQFTSPFARDPIYNSTLDQWANELLEQQGPTQDDSSNVAPTDIGEDAPESRASDIVDDSDSNDGSTGEADGNVESDANITPGLNQLAPMAEPPSTSEPDTMAVSAPVDEFADPTLSEPSEFLASSNVDAALADSSGSEPFMDASSIDFGGGDSGGGSPIDDGGMA